MYFLAMFYVDIAGRSSVWGLQ